MVVTLRFVAVALRVAGPPLAARQLPWGVAAMLILSQLWTILPWGAIRDGLGRLGPVGDGLGFGAAALAWGLAWGGPWRAALLEAPALRPLWRLAPGRAARGLAGGLVALDLAAPLALAAGLWPWAGPPGLLLAGGLGALSVVAAAGGLGSALAGAGLAGLGWALAGALGPGPALLGLAALGPGALEAGMRRVEEGLARGELGAPAGAPGRGWAPQGPLGALVRLDTWALRRTAPRLLLLPLVPALPAGVLAWGLARHGGELALRREVAGVWLVIAGFAGLLWVDQLRRGLGTHFDPGAAPVSPRLRAASLVGLAFAGELPVLLAALAGDPAGLGGAGGTLLAAAAATAALGALAGAWPAEVEVRAPMGLFLGAQVGVALAVVLGEATHGVGLGLAAVAAGAFGALELRLGWRRWGRWTSWGRA